MKETGCLDEERNNIKNSRAFVDLLNTKKFDWVIICCQQNENRIAPTVAGINSDWQISDLQQTALRNPWQLYNYQGKHVLCFSAPKEKNVW